MTKLETLYASIKGLQMEHADQNYDIKQKQLICLGLIAMNESLSATQLIGLLNLKNADSLRSWLHPLIDKGLVAGVTGTGTMTHHTIERESRHTAVVVPFLVRLYFPRRAERVLSC